MKFEIEMTGNEIIEFEKVKSANQLGFTKDFLRILPLRQGPNPNLSPARFARRPGITKDFLRILPLRKAQNPIFAGALRAPG